METTSKNKTPKKRKSLRYRFFQLLLVVFFLQYLCMAPDVSGFTIDSATQADLCKLHRSPESFVNIPISIDKARIQTSQYFLLWGFYFIQPDNEQCNSNLIVFSNNRSFTNQTPVKVFGKVRSLKIGKKQILFMRERNTVEKHGYAVNTHQGL